jgi:tRNA A-37 threonylcarbamoyl transferase component Bud32
VGALDIDPETWAVLNRLLDAALDLPASERERWLAGLGIEYEALKPRVRALLAHASSERGEALFGNLPKPEDDAVAPGSGPRLGRYELRGLLGVGGMGRVYRAFDSVLGREVAIKTLAKAYRDEASRQRVEREARLLATLNHPNVAAIYGFELSAGVPCLILELVEGETLSERLKRGPLPADQVVRVAIQLALALEEAHGKGIVHRDLKPTNVKLGASGLVKVLDFGIAKPMPRVNAAGTPAPNPDPTTQAGVGAGNGALHEPRADPRRARRPAHGHLGVRMPRLRDAERNARVRRRVLGRGRGLGPPRRHRLEPAAG